MGVSGAASADQDEKLAIAGSNAFAPQSGAMSASPSAEVSYFARNKVDAAFAQGSVLLDGSNGRNYMVASHREKPGQAEIHTKDADVIYVLDGSATFVTGGEAVDAKTTGPDELRGSSIRNGETRKIARGDVIVVLHLTKRGCRGMDIGEYGQPGSNGLTLDKQGRLTTRDRLDY